MPGERRRDELKGTAVTLARWLRVFVLLGAALAPQQYCTAAQARLALVIGNQAYPERPLANPVNDAHALAAVLRRLGFNVDLRVNIQRAAMQNAVRRFAERLARSEAAVGLFYFAGHGLQIAEHNYLIPLGGAIRQAHEVRSQGLAVNWVLEELRHAHRGVNIVILDACRDNPFSGVPTTQLQLGLAPMPTPPMGTFIAYATAPGRVASDALAPASRHSVYTQHLLTHLPTPGAPIERVFKEVRKGVARDTQGTQVPWDSSGLIGEFYFWPPRPRRD